MKPQQVSSAAAEESMMSGWGPDERKASVSFTFDHLGEAAELEFGLWPDDASIGQHPSVIEVLPKLLSILAGQGVRATFFVEAWNVEYYPGALEKIAEHGHEVACHGFRHENWEHLSVSQIDEIMRRSLAAYASREIAVSGVRPPGGIPPKGYADVLRGHGLQYISMADDGYGTADGLAHVPFQWRAIDGAYYWPRYAHLRQPPGEGTVAVSEMLKAWEKVVDDVVNEGGHVSFIFHVPWQNSDERLVGLEDFASRLVNDDRIWLARADEVSGWMLKRPHAFKYEERRPAVRAWSPGTVKAATLEDWSQVSQERDTR